MKWIFLFLGFYGFSQDDHRIYILLDSLANDYDIKKYTLNTQELYGIDRDIEMYNVFWKDGMLLLISVLPDLESGKDWEKIDIKLYESKLQTAQKIMLRGMDALYKGVAYEGYREAKEMNTYKLIKRKGNSYYECSYCLFEWFHIVDYPPFYKIGMPTNSIINLGQEMVSMEKFETVGEKLPVPLGIPEFTPDYLNNIYLSRKELVNGDMLYRFWTYSDWRVIGFYNVQRGIDRFAYIPGKGIVGGSYDFYFWFKNPRRTRKYKYEVNLSPEQWKQNIYDEKIMWAKELFPEKQ
ncbi:MAG: hypothetical protein Q4G08_07810 [Capnocytophaga sp.]|nr:hypothetical protein [Capnocytophaga sp.]